MLSLLLPPFFLLSFYSSPCLLSLSWEEKWSFPTRKYLARKWKYQPPSLVIQFSPELFLPVNLDVRLKTGPLTVGAWWQVTVWEAVNPRPTAAFQWPPSRGSGLGIRSHVGCCCKVISEFSRFTNHLVGSCHAAWFMVKGALLQMLVSSFFPVVAWWFSCFWCDMHLLIFIWILPPPNSVMEQMSQCLLVPVCGPISSSFLWWVGTEEDGAPDWQRGQSVLLPNCPENIENYGHISQNEYLGSIQDRQGQEKGCSCSVGGGVVWLEEALEIHARIYNVLFWCLWQLWLEILFWVF